MDIVYALKRQGRTLYGFGGERTAVSRKRTQEEKENEAVEKEARRLAFQANQRGQATPPNSDHRAQAKQQVQARPAARHANELVIQYQGLTVKAVPAGSVFEYEDGSGGYRRSKGLNGPLYDQVVAVEARLCDVGTGVGIRQSLKPSDEGGGLVYQAGSKLLIATEGNAVKGLAIVCTYEIGEGLIEPRGFGTPTDAFARSQAGTPILMLELICARGEATASGRGDGNHLAAKGLVECMKRYSTAQRYGFVVAKAENARSRDFLRRRVFDVILTKFECAFRVLDQAYALRTRTKQKPCCFRGLPRGFFTD
jgi:hypothetical protein